MDRAVGIVAGSGDMPAEALAALRSLGRRVVIVGIDEASAEDPGADDFRRISIGRVRDLLDFFRGRGVRQLLMLGKLDKGLHFVDIEFDELALSILQGMQGRADMSFFKAISGALEQEGFSVLPQTAALGPLLCPEGQLTRAGVGDRGEDVRKALDLAAGIAGLDIGQAVAVRQGACVAVEAFEHTDSMIARAGDLAGQGIVVAKVPRPSQDPRFDVPAIGPDTIRGLARISAAGLALAAGEVFVLDREGTVRIADEAGLFVIGVDQYEAF